MLNELAVKDRQEHILTKSSTENTPVKPQALFKISHSFKTENGYLRRGRAGDNDLSIAMFVKDEGETIYEVLNAVKAVALEYVIGIDESTIDNTRDEIVRFRKMNPNHKFILYNFKWCDDFSYHRNQAIEKCTHSWILILDGHDLFQIDNINTLVDVMNTMHDDVLIVQFLIYMSPDKYNIPTTFFPQPRLIRNNPKLRYESAIHNVLRSPKIFNKVVVSDLIILHKRSENKKAIRSKQRQDIGVKFFEKVLKDKPKDLRSLFYLGNIYLEDTGDSKKAIEYYTKYLDVDDGVYRDERSQVMINLCSIYIINNMSKEAFAMAAKGIGEGYQRREFWMLLGQLLFNNGDSKSAIPYFLMSTKLPMPMCNLFLNGAMYTHAPWESLAQCYIKLENYRKARECYINMLEFMPKNPIMIANIRNCESKMHIKEKVKSGINIIFFDSNRVFIDSVCAQLSKKNNVRLSSEFDLGLANMADMIFIEWADNNAIQATEIQLETPVILRVHKYELFTPHFKLINFNNVSALIFTSEHIKKLAIEMYPNQLENLELNNKLIIIPSNVNTDYFKLLNEWDNKQIVILGKNSYTKNYQMIFELAYNNPDLVFNIIGDTSIQLDHIPFFKHKSDKIKNVIFHGNIQQNELNRKISEIKPGFIINTSLIEGCPYNILEMMSKGIIPILYDYPGACEGLKLDNSHIYNSVNGFRVIYNHLKNKPKEYRKTLRAHVKSNFDDLVILPKIENVMMNIYDNWFVNYKYKKDPLKEINSKLLELDEVIGEDKG